MMLPCPPSEFPPLFPSMLVHCDWSVDARKRWMACAILGEDGKYHLQLPKLVGDPKNLLDRVWKAKKQPGSVFIGFDFPIGLPSLYAQKCQVDLFLSVLPQLGQSHWIDFYQVAETPDQIHLKRPFYPKRSGHARQSHLLEGLSVNHINELRRRCEMPHAHRRAAAPLFWTLGGQQVGKAAISGWRDVLVPGLAQSSFPISIWPFSGALSELLADDGIVIAETYPGEIYHHLGIDFKVPADNAPGGGRSRGSKRLQESRKANVDLLVGWAICFKVQLDPELQIAIQRGFGARLDGEDQFDALVGLLGMLNIVSGYRDAGEPEEPHLRNIEGWILGQRHGFPV